MDYRGPPLVSQSDGHRAGTDGTLKDNKKRPVMTGDKNSAPPLAMTILN